MKEPVDHVLRPILPWRGNEGAITECGYDASKVKTLTRAEFFKRQKDFGDQRAALFTCMTCSDTAKRWGTWDDDPRLAVHREVEWERGGFYYRARADRGERLKDELIAIAALIDAHKDEFAAAVTELSARRDWLDKKSTMQSKPRPPSIGGL